VLILRSLTEKARMPNFAYQANLSFEDGRQTGVEGLFVTEVTGTDALDDLVSDLRERHVRSGEVPEVTVFTMHLVSPK
jgi:hypothetical protein